MLGKKQVLIGAGSLAGVAVLSIGGISAAFASGALHSDPDDSPLSGSVLQRATDAALKAAGGGKVTDAEHADESGSAYEVEVTLSNGRQVEVDLDKRFAVVNEETEAKDGSEQPLTGATLDQARAAALEAAGGGKVTDAEHADESGSAYEVEVTLSNGKELEVDLDKHFAVVDKEVDTEG